jgi:hypothetical protein
MSGQTSPAPERGERRPPGPAVEDVDEQVYAPRRPAVEVAPRRARVYVQRVDPWSITKAWFMTSVAVAIMLLVAVALLWLVLDRTGVFEALARTLDEVIGSGTTTFDVRNLVSLPRVMGVTVLVAAFEIVLVSFLATLFAFLYNLTVGITGGVEVTLSDDM